MKAAVAHLRRSDPVMAKIIERVGPCKLALLQPNFETLARSITFQQLHGKAASTIFARVQKAVGRSFTATAFLKADEQTLRGLRSFAAETGISDRPCRARGAPQDQL